MRQNAACRAARMVLRPGQRDIGVLLREIVQSRYMFANLVRSAAVLPYTDMVVGVLWTMCRPLLFLAVVVFIKNRSGAQMEETVEYELFVLSGLMAWWYFVDAAKNASNAVFSYRSLITKIYMPRIIIPAIPVVARSFDLFVQTVVLLPFMASFGHWPDRAIVVLPLVILNLMVLALGIGYVVTSLALFVRDVQRILDYILYVGLFLSPVIYGVRMIPDGYKALYAALNPMAGPLIALRSALFAETPMEPVLWLISASVAVAFLFVGVWMFMRVSDVLAERVL